MYLVRTSYTSFLILSWTVIFFLVSVNLSGFVQSAFIGENCTTFDECKEDNKYSFCFNDTCKCYLGSYVAENNILECQDLVGDNCTEHGQPNRLTPHSSCINGTVNCLPGFVPGPRTCVPGNVSIGGECQIYTQCYDASAECDDNVCHCRAGIVTINNTDYCNFDHSNNRCLISELCPKRSSCHNHHCRCELGYSLNWESSCHADSSSLYQYCESREDCQAIGDFVDCFAGQCKCIGHDGDIVDVINTASGVRQCSKYISSLDKKCGKYDTIHVDGAECRNNITVCRHEYKRIGDDCIEDVAIDLGDQCIVDFQCLKKNNNTVCKNTCQCIRSLVQTDVPGADRCVQKVDLGDSCDRSHICKIPDSSCVDGTCTCNQSYSEQAAYTYPRCLKDTSPHKSLGFSTTTIVIICALAITGVFFLIMIVVKLKNR